MPTKNFKDFCHTKQTRIKAKKKIPKLTKNSPKKIAIILVCLVGQKYLKILVGILGETMTSQIHSEFKWPLKMFSKIFYQPIEMISLVLHFISSWRSLILWSLITENELIWNATLCRHRFLRQFFLSFFSPNALFTVLSKLYIPSTINIDFLLWQLQLIVDV